MRLRIDELAARTGVTSRNIRAYREKGLLPPPELEGRTGYYTEDHVRRLEIIDYLQQRGFSLEAIRQTLEAWTAGGDFSHLLTLKQILDSPFQTEEPEIEPVESLLARFPEALQDPSLLQRAIRLGLVEPGPSNKLRIPSPMLIDAGTELTAIGMSLAEILDLFETVQADLANIAEEFVGVAERHLVTPVEMGRPGAPSPPKVIEALERLRPLALEMMRPMMARELVTAVERAVDRLAEAVNTAREAGEAEG